MMSGFYRAAGDQRLTDKQVYGICKPKSVWTIDLAYLLKQVDVHHFTYFTSSIGVKKEHMDDVRLHLRLWW